MATASIACSILSRRSTTSEGIRGFLDSASTLREYARTTGIPSPQMIAVANAPSGTAISGPTMLALPLGADAVSWYRQLNLGSFAQRASSVHSSIVRPHCLTRDCQTQSGAAGLVGHVRLPDRLQLFRRDTFAVVRHRDLDRALTAQIRRSCTDRDATTLTRCIHRIEQNVAQRSR